MTAVHNARISMKHFFLAIFAIIIFAPASASTSTAFDEQEFQRLINTTDLSEEANCQAIWTVLWSAAQSGNLEARANLFLMVMPPGPHLHSITLPGRTSDAVTKLRDALTLGLHASGAHFKEEDASNIFYGWLSTLVRERTFQPRRSSAVLMCLQSSPSANCAAIAVKQELVPDFRAFTLEVEAMMSANLKPTCT